ncbi:hypothetical protein BG000_006543, partial [Podila horticola]
YFLFFQTKDAKAMAWSTRFTITDANGNPRSLTPLPLGSMYNPGINGTISTPPPATFSTAPTASGSAPGTVRPIDSPGSRSVSGSSKSEARGESNLGGIIGGVVSGLAVVALAIGFLIYRGRSKTRQEVNKKEFQFEQKDSENMVAKASLHKFKGTIFSSEDSAAIKVMMEDNMEYKSNTKD